MRNLEWSLLNSSLASLHLILAVCLFGNVCEICCVLSQIVLVSEKCKINNNKVVK